MRLRTQDLRLTVTQLCRAALRRPHAAARQQPNAHTASLIPRNSSPSSGNHAYLSYVIGSRRPAGQEATPGAAVPLGTCPSSPEPGAAALGRDGRPPGLQRRLLCHSSPQGRKMQHGRKRGGGGGGSLAPVAGRRRASGGRRAGRPSLTVEAEAPQVFPLSTKQTSQQTSLLNSLISGDSGEAQRLAPSIPRGRASSSAGVQSTRRLTESEEPPGTRRHRTARRDVKDGRRERRRRCWCRRCCAQRCDPRCVGG